MSIFGAAIDGIIATAEGQQRNSPGNELDYMENNLLICGNCHTRKQMRLDVPGVGLRTVPVLCKCGIERRDQEEARQKAIKEMEYIDKLRREGISIDKYRKMTFAADDGLSPDLMNIARGYVENRAEMLRENIGLLFHGDTDGGKTFLAAAIANAMIDHCTSAMITTIPELITAMSRDFEANKADILGKIARVGFLVLDDVGFERQTSYAAEKLYEIIDTRYQAHRPLIVTTNLSLDEIANPTQMEYKRPFERIVEMCQPVYVPKAGRRKAIAQEKSKIARRILGM